MVGVAGGALMLLLAVGAGWALRGTRSATDDATNSAADDAGDDAADDDASHRAAARVDKAG